MKYGFDLVHAYYMQERTISKIFIIHYVENANFILSTNEKKFKITLDYSSITFEMTLGNLK